MTSVQSYLAKDGKDRIVIAHPSLQSSGFTLHVMSFLLASNALVCCWRWVKLKFHGTVFHVTSSWHPREDPRRHARLVTEDVRNKWCMSCVSGDFLVQLATRLPDWSAGGLLRHSAARLSVCRCRSPKSTSTTRTTCCGHPRGDPRADPRSILVRHVRHARFPRDLLASS